MRCLVVRRRAIIVDVVRLTGGVVAGRSLGIWAPGHDGVPVAATTAALEPGTPVVVGPAGAGGSSVEAALEGLAALVAAGGAVAAGAGVDVGHGFRSARLAGAPGDRRDAVLAALRVLEMHGTQRLGDRAGVLVALFGPRATKPVGAAAMAAVRDGRWGALRLACAASDLLGPEQLETVLALSAPAGFDPMSNGTASVLAGHLAAVLGPLSGPRRLSLLLDLWRQVCAEGERGQRRERLRAARGRHDRFEELLVRHRHFVDDQLLRQVRADVYGEPTLAEAARWVPRTWHCQGWLRHAMHDALCATVLVRTAIAVADHGMAGGLARCWKLIAAAPFLMSNQNAAPAARPVPGLIGVPARPGCYLRDLDRRLAPGGPIDRATSQFVAQRLARARDYALVARDALLSLVGDLEDRRAEIGDDWHCPHLRRWRWIAGYSPTRPPAGWDQPPFSGQERSLAERLRAEPDTDPSTVETPGDLLWYADLADALARLNGHEAALVEHGGFVPTVDVEPPRPAPQPLRPRLDSVPLAVAGAAQLVGLGAEVPPRARGWAELVDGLLAATVVAEALTGGFPVPAPLAARDGATVPGTGVRLELAHEPHRLAEWAAYMGNCIAGDHYLRAAAEGGRVLAALRDPDGRIVANAELAPHGTGRGWHIVELQARFNAPPDPDIAAHLRAWLAGVPSAVPARVHAPVRPHSRGRVGARRRSRVLRDVGEPLDALAGQALRAPATVEALAVLGGTAGVVALRRAGASGLDDAVRGAADLAALWRATAVRPLANALAALDPALRQRCGNLDLLLADTPLPGAPRRLARLPEVASARSIELVARRLRAAIGRLAGPELGPAVAQHADTAMLCALVLAASTRDDPSTMPLTAPGSVAVPGFPESSLDDEAGPWRRAWPDAMELGAGPRPPASLRVPAAWLGPGGWPALWSRAARAMSP
jgi:hypothetical protein